MVHQHAGEDVLGGHALRQRLRGEHGRDVQALAEGHVVLELAAPAAAAPHGGHHHGLHAAAAAAEAAAAAAATPEERVATLIAAADALSALQPDRALAVLSQAEGPALAGQMAGELARIHAIRGNIHFPAGRLEDCLASHRQALVWARRAGRATAEAGALSGLAWAHYQKGEFAAAETQASQCLAMADGEVFDRIRLAALRVRGVTRLFLLRHEAAEADARQAVALAAAQGDAFNEVLARTTLGTVHLERGDADTAFAAAEPALALCDSRSGLGVEAAPLWVMGAAAAMRGDAAEALALLTRAREAGGRPAIRFGLPRILGTLACLVPAAERAALVGEGAALLERLGAAHSAFGFWASAAQAGLAFEDHALLDRALAGFERFAGADPAPWPATVMELCRRYGALNRNPRHAEVRRAALAFCEMTQARPELAWLRPSMRIVEARTGLA